MLSLLIPLVLAPGNPAIQLWLGNDGRFVPGDYASVQVQTSESGYLLVLRAAPDGQVTVLFPLRPGDNSLVRGGERYQLKDDEGRDGFAITGSYGKGLVYAAVSASPFRFDDYRRIDSWDEQALGPLAPDADPETALTELVKAMATGDFDYDVVAYDVIERVVYASDYGFGFPFFSSCSPFFLGPSFQCPFFFHRFDHRFNREPRLITRFGPRRFVPGSSGGVPVTSRDQRQERQRESWPVDVSPRSSQLRAMARREGWPLDVSPRQLPNSALGLRTMGPRSPGLSPVTQPGGPLEPRLRSFAPHAVPALRGPLVPRLR